MPQSVAGHPLRPAAPRNRKVVWVYWTSFLVLTGLGLHGLLLGQALGGFIEWLSVLAILSFLFRRFAMPPAPAPGRGSKAD